MFTTESFKTRNATEPTSGPKAPVRATGLPEPNPVWQSLALDPAGIGGRLNISQPGDPFEQEADRTAERVMRMADRAEGAGDHSQPIPGEAKESRKRTRSTAGKSGKPLDPAARAFFEPRFGQDFGNVTVHNDSSASASASAVKARAFTVGEDIFYGPGAEAPGSKSHLHLLAHELTHVLQHREGRSQTGIQRQPDTSYVDHGPTAHAMGTFDSKSRVYTVPSDKSVYPDQSKPYDTFYSIALRFGTTAQALQQLNGETLRPGQQIKIPTAVSESKSQHQESKQTTVKPEPKKKTALNEAAKSPKLKGVTSGAGEHGIDYSRLLKDKRLDIGVAFGHEFSHESTSIVEILTSHKFTVKQVSDTKSTYWKKVKMQIPGDESGVPIEFEITVDLIDAAKKNPEKTYSEYLATDDVAIYSGHSREGASPDFDSEESPEQNFVIGVNSAKHKEGKLKKGSGLRMNKLLKGEKNDLEEMSKEGKFDNEKYQVWMFNSCTSRNFLDEVRGGLVTDKAGTPKSSTNLRFFGTKHSIRGNAAPILEGLLSLASMEKIIEAMNAHEIETVKRHNKAKPSDQAKLYKSYYFSD